MQTVMRRAAARLLLVVLFIALFPAALDAKEATKRGRNATIIWLDENGKKHETRGGEIRYGYFTRSILSVPRGGKNFYDDEHQDKGLSFVGEFLRFSKITRIDFHHENVEGQAAARLVMTITPLRGKKHVEPGNRLMGWAHPLSPFIAFRVDGVERRIELLPLGTDDDFKGKHRIVSAIFTL